MTQLFFKAASFTSNRATVQLQKVEPLMQVLENDAYGHWIFGENSSSLTDKVNNRNLTVQSGASTAPSYTANNVHLATTVGNSLLTSLTDTSNQDFTMCAVVKADQATLTILLGNLVPSSSTVYSGSGVFVSGDVGYVTIKPSIANHASVNGVSSLAAGSAHNQSEYFFIAMSVNKTTKNATVYVLQNTERFAEKAYTAAGYDNSNKLAIGNAFYNGGTGSASFAEAIVYDKALTVDQIKAIASRSRERMSDRNIYF